MLRIYIYIYIHMICHTSIKINTKDIKLITAFPCFFMVQGPPSTLGRFLFNLHLSQQARQRCRCHPWCRRLLSKRRNGAVSAVGDQAAEEAAAQRTQLPGTDQLIANLGEPLWENPWENPSRRTPGRTPGRNPGRPPGRTPGRTPQKSWGLRLELECFCGQLK